MTVERQGFGRLHLKIHENDHLEAYYRPGSSPFTLITFAHLSFESQGKYFWAMQMAERLDLDCIGIVAKQNNWYPSAAMLELLPNIQSIIARPVILYGHSMGAHAAIKYSRLLGATGTIASAPMTTIDPADVPDDKRFHKFFSHELMANMAIRPEDVSGKVVVCYDPYCKSDRFYVDLLKGIVDDRSFYEVRAHFFEHECVQALLDRDILFSLIGSCFHGYQQKIVPELIRRVKRRDINYPIKLAEYVTDQSRYPKSKEKMVSALVAKVTLRENAPWYLIVIGNQLLARCAERRGDLTEASRLIQHALQVEYNEKRSWEPNMQAWLAHLQFSHGDYHAASGLYRIVIKSGHPAYVNIDQALLCAERADDFELEELILGERGIGISS